VESLLLFEYEVGLSSSSVRAGDSVLMTADAHFAFAEEYNSEMYWYLVSADDVVYAIGEAYNPLPSAVAVEIIVPELAEPGDYTLVIAEWRIYLTSGGVYEYMIEIPLTVLPAEPLEDDIAELELRIAELELQLEALQDQLDEMNATVAAGDTDLMAEIASLMTELDSLSAAMEASNEDVADEISALQEQVSALESELSDLLDSLNGTQDSVDDVQASVDNKMDGVLGYAIIGLLVVVILLMVVMMVMGRKPKAPMPLPEPPIE
jgi:DNA repair exonuclease SbcCD ATPase subunit